MNERQINVRLTDIDNTERGQPHANKAKHALSKLIFGKQVTVVPVTTDHYGPTVDRDDVDSSRHNTGVSLEQSYLNEA